MLGYAKVEAGAEKRRQEFTEAARPLVKYLAENHHPHVTALVTGNGAELLEGLCAFTDDTFVKD